MESLVWGNEVFIIWEVEPLFTQQILPELLSYGATLDLGLGHKNLYEIVQFQNFQMV